MQKYLVVTAMAVMLLCTTFVAHADNNPSVTGHAKTQIGVFSWDLNVTAVQKKDGSLVGRLKLERLRKKFEKGS